MGESGDRLDEREDHVWRTFRRMRDQLALALNQHLQQDAGISEADFQVLAALTDAPDHAMRARTLRTELQWEKSRLAHQIRRMEQRGLVARHECVEDGRAAMVRLTDAGLARGRAAAQAHAALVRELFFHPLAPAQVDALHEAAAVVLARLQQTCPAEAP
ncbi:helix-turn-helix domain-containing protein [Micromonospora sp. WMMD812]|uniref:MarR family winged helix-turn-helix transcriptional regulator n=1 Tax=Micromonospora sp. WMMD812 TaxID=3015152 RepID=UPI00248C2736|nr:helix-turn-helix domain-containing protein [Micromonospora sp. WMMD812]WBB65235.1 helix-turn-helix domain-containing protein [Micromonospora sp. WMMD812]